MNNKRSGFIKSELTIPCHWNKDVLDQIMIESSRSLNAEVVEIYGTLANGPIAHGRQVNSVLDISRKKAIDFRVYVRERYGIDFIYVINAPFLEAELSSSEKEYLDWIVNEFQPEALMVMAPTLIKYIIKTYPKVKIYISTIAGIKDLKGLEKYLPYGPKKIVGHHDLNRNFDDLKKIKEACDQNGIELEIMTTESCLRGCPFRDAHYLYLAKKNKDTVFHTDCNSRKLKNPYELLKSNFIRPEDIKLYNEMGISKFKITGRSKPAEWLPDVVLAYLQGAYDGNLVRLLGIDPSYKFEEWIFINNKSLDGFLESFPQNGNMREENKYCNEWIIDLYDSNHFNVEDITYQINDNGVLENREVKGKAREYNII